MLNCVVEEYVPIFDIVMTSFCRSPRLSSLMTYERVVIVTESPDTAEPGVNRSDAVLVVLSYVTETFMRRLDKSEMVQYGKELALSSICVSIADGN
jgi:hypothetical protein